MAVKTRAELKAENSSDFPDNAHRLISPSDLRGQMDDIVDSMLMEEDNVGGGGGGGSVSNDPYDEAAWDAVIGIAPSQNAVRDKLAAMDAQIEAINNEGGAFIHEPGTSPPAYVRSFNDRLKDTVHLLDFIPTAEHAAIKAYTSTYDALPAIHNALNQFSVPQGVGSAGGPHLLLPRGKIRISGPIQLHCTCTIDGASGGYSSDNGFPSIIEVVADQTGIIVHRFDTLGAGLASAVWDSTAPFTAYVVGATVSSHQNAPLFSGFYECIVAGGGASDTRPTHTSGDVAYADGYTWRLLDIARGADGAVLRNFALKSLGGTVGHGIWMRARASCYDLSIKDFPQNGYNIVALGGTGGTNGNANNWRIYNGRVTGCRNGLFADGEEANAGLASGLDCSANDGWGFWDDSFLGNVFVGCHTNGNGTTGACQYDGYTWLCVDETNAGTNPPGTDATTWWQQAIIGGGTLAPLWVSGTTYIAGGAGVGSLVQSATSHGTYRCTIAGGGTSTDEPVHVSGTAAYGDGYSWIMQNNAALWVPGFVGIEGGCFKMYSNSAVLVGCYAEGGQPAFLDLGTLAIFPGFGFDNLVEGNGRRGFLWTTRGINALTYNGIDTLGEKWTYKINDVGQTDFVTSFNHPTLAAGNLTDKLDHVAGVMHHLAANSNSTRTYMKTLQGTTTAFGRSAPVPHAMFVDRLFVGQNSTVGRQITNQSAMPTTGNWAAGDIVLNNAPLLGEPWGWRCILTGTPGTWQPLRDLGSQQTLATNAVFTLTPGTSPYHTLHTGTLTADRVVTLSTTGAFNGLAYKITRTGAGAFNLNVGTGPLKAMAVNTWAEFVYDGTAYYLSAYGTL